MDTLDVARVCARRWYIFLLVLGLAYYASMGLTRQRHADYTSTGNFALIYHLPTTLKPNERDPRETNPLGGGNGQLLKQSIVNDLRSASSQATLAPAHHLRMRGLLRWPLERMREGWDAMIEALSRGAAGTP